MFRYDIKAQKIFETMAYLAPIRMAELLLRMKQSRPVLGHDFTSIEERDVKPASFAFMRS